MVQSMWRGSLKPFGALTAVLGFFFGGVLVFDGSLKLAKGLYTAEDTVGRGPWASVVSLVGIGPDEMAIPSILLGILWVVNSILVIARTRSRFERTILSGAPTLFYLTPGTIIGFCGHCAIRHHGVDESSIMVD